MDKTCEFCGALQPVVYCQPDTAFLCLSCDAKVHSANALSGRHSRALVCDSCRLDPAHYRCLDHLMLLCRGCETRIHQFMPQHRKQRISSFSGCPSANHFAALWGFGIDGSGRVSVSGHQHKVVSNQQHNYLIKQQIVDLEKLQLTMLTQDGNRLSTTLECRREPVTSGKLTEGFHRQSKELDYFLSNNPQGTSQELKKDRFSSPMSQLDHLSCSSSGGEPFWQYKSSGDNSQFWSQNLQDLGVCEDLASLDDLNIPDVDATFRNFEDLFTNDLDLTQALLEEDDQNSHSKSTTQDVFAASSSFSMTKDISSETEGRRSRLHNAQVLSRSVVQYSPYMMMRSSSLSRSRLSGESSGSECLNSGNSGGVTKERKNGRIQGKQTQLAPRKSKGEMHKKNKGRFVNIEGYESDAMSLSKSY